VFDEIFGNAGTSFDARVGLRSAKILARHAWDDTQTFDLHADLKETADAVGRFAGAAEARGFLEFSARAKNIYDTLEKPFLRAQLPTPVSLATGAGLSGLPGLLRISPFETLSRALAKFFSDPRLRQLFGRYATYCGSSPYLAPATLMLVAHVERDGVWLVKGGMYQLGAALAALGRHRGECRSGRAATEFFRRGRREGYSRHQTGRAFAIRHYLDIAGKHGGLCALAPQCVFLMRLQGRIR
jgi:1-hydroxycarotenoid 3,4-desaturase